jgi:hypothetical protein
MGAMEYVSGTAATLLVLAMVIAIHGVGRGLVVLVALPVLVVGGTLLFGWLIAKTGLLRGHPGWHFFASVVAAWVFFDVLGRIEGRLRKAEFFEKLRSWFTNRSH